MRMKFRALARRHDIHSKQDGSGGDSGQARQTTSINRAAAERSRVPAFPDSKTPFWPRLPVTPHLCRAIDLGVSKDRSNVIEQDASQRACQLISTSSDRDSRENVSQCDDWANSKQRP
jgi:hypothetical protein